MVASGVRITGLILVLAAIGIPEMVNKSTKQQPANLRVMSYNIRFDNPADGINRWDNRRERVSNLIRFHSPHIIGLQEAEYHQITWLVRRLQRYGWSGVGRTDGKKAGEFSPVLFDTTRYAKLDGDTFWLSPKPDTPGKGWDAALPRIVSWVHLKAKDSGEIFFFFNTHFDHRGQEARKESARLILDKITQIAGRQAPVVLTGDFNATPDSEPYKILTERLKDGFDTSLIPHYGPEVTFLGKGGPFYVAGGKGGRRIDYIFASRDVKVIRHGIIGSFREGRFPSDHLPVLAEIDI